MKDSETRIDVLLRRCVVTGCQRRIRCDSPGAKKAQTWDRCIGCEAALILDIKEREARDESPDGP